MNNENETNKSIVTSYRLKEDTKENIKRQLDQLGLTQEQYFNKVVAMMELENVKQNNIFAVNATELQDLTQRIYNIFIGLCEQGNSFLSGKDTELEELKVKYKDMLLDKENKITEQSKELQEVYNDKNILQIENDNNKNELMNIRIEHSKELERLESSLNDKKLIVEEYKQKNDMLLSDLKELQELMNIRIELEKELDQLKADSTNKDNTINELNKSIDELNSKHNTEIENIKNQFNIDKANELLTLRTTMNDKIENINTKHNAEIENWQSKYNLLLERLEKEKTTKEPKEEPKPGTTTKNNTNFNKNK